VSALTGESRRVSGRPAYRDANVVRWLVGFATSLVGDQVYFVALAWAATQVAEPAQVGLVLAAGSVPRLVLLLVGGVLADRWGAKRLMIGSDVVRSAVMATAALLLVTTTPTVVLLVVVAVVFGVVDALFLPAVGSLPPRLVEAPELARVQAMRGLVQRSAIVVGAPLGGWVVATHGAAAAFAVNAVTFAVSVLALAATRLRPAPDVPAAPQSAVLSEVAGGIGYVRRSRLLLPLLAAAAVGELGFTGPFNVGVPLLAAENGWGATGVGLLVGAFGLGAAVTTLALVVVGRLPRAGLAIGISICLMALAIAGIGLAPTRATAVVAALLLGLAGGVSGSLFGALMLASTDAAYLGRVVSLSSLASFGGIPVGYAATGALAGAFGPSSTFVLGAALSAAAGSAAPRTKVLEGPNAPARTPVAA